MGMTEQPFRTAAIGGFHRQDVLNYIEASARTAAERLETLQKEADGLRQTGTAAAAAVASAEARADALEREETRLTAALEEKTAALTAADEALARERAEREALGAELAALRARYAKTESGAAAYAELKDRTGTIELEAHQRAMLIEHAAQEKAKRVTAEAEQLVYRVQAGYARLRADMDAAIAHAGGELGRIDKTLEGVKGEFAEHDAAFTQLLDACRRQEGHRPPDPLPLGEEA